MANGPTLSSTTEILSSIDLSIRKEFDSNRRVLSFDEYIALLGENPEQQTRGSARYAADMMDFFGKTTIPSSENSSGLTRFKLFDLPVDGQAQKVVGHEQVQNHIYRAFRNFSRQSFNNRLILLHGPNGSAKSSLIHALMNGLEHYSHEAGGAIYSFNWVFPVERYTKSGIGINTRQGPPREPLQSYAKIPDEEVAARLPCDLKDHPLLVIPQEHRFEFLQGLLGPEKAHQLWDSMPIYLTQGDLCHRCRQIFDNLLVAHNGDFRKILMHIQVERIYFARRYRQGLVTIEPQLHVDAQYHQLSYNRSLGSLPVSLQSLNLFTLTGDLVDGNRGMIEYSDILKRPVDTFKYLLSACETGSINVGSSIAYLDTVLIGSTNELQLDAFKEFPDFISFKARIELIRVPYLLSVSQEQEIYDGETVRTAREKHVAPHSAWSTALWAVLTRLKKSNNINYPPNISGMISNLTPIEKSRLYDTGEVPASLSPEDRKILRSSIKRIREEYANVPYYEGRTGASAREMKSILHDAAHNSDFPCLSPLAILREMEEFVKRVSEYEFLKQEVKDGYHDAVEFIHVVRNEYLTRIDREVRDSIGLYNSNQWEEFLKKYVQQISLVLKREKTKNPITGKMEDPDYALINELEKIIEVPEDSTAKEAFRQNIISQIGAWSLDHPKETVVYAKVFPDFWRKLEKHYYESQKTLLTKMHDALLVYGSETSPLDTPTENSPFGQDPDSEGAVLARQTVNNMVARQGYCLRCAKEVISFLLKQRY